MPTHVHKFKVLRDSVFGLTKVNALMKCIGVQKGGYCEERRGPMILEYANLEKKVSPAGFVTYFYTEPPDKGGKDERPITG